MSEVNVRIRGFARIDYNRAPIRKVLRQQIALVREEARELVSSASPSSPGEYPGQRKGILKRAIKSKALRSGLAAVARPEKTPRMGDDYYPAFLLHGVKQRGGRPLNPGLQPRGDYMVDALDNRSSSATDALRDALEAALVPRA